MKKMRNSKTISVEIIEHRETGLLVGLSSDMAGLYVHGRSVEEVERRIPLAIKEILEAEGKNNVRVVSLQEDAIPAPFASRSVRKFELAA